MIVLKYAAFLGFLLWPTMMTAQQRTSTGTFAIWVCPKGCAVRDTVNADVIGYLVLSDTTLIVDIEPLRVLGPEPEGPPACFHLVQRKRGASFAGIIRSARTTWTRKRDSVSVLLYASPDAFYTLTAVVEGGVLRGIGRQEGFIGVPFNSPGGDVHGVRIGKAEGERCRDNSS